MLEELYQDLILRTCQNAELVLVGFGIMLIFMTIMMLVIVSLERQIIRYEKRMKGSTATKREDLNLTEEQKEKINEIIKGVDAVFEKQDRFFKEVEKKTDEVFKEQDRFFENIKKKGPRK